MIYLTGQLTSQTCQLTGQPPVKSKLPSLHPRTDDPQIAAWGQSSPKVLSWWNFHSAASKLALESSLDWDIEYGGRHLYLVRIY